MVCVDIFKNHESRNPSMIIIILQEKIIPWPQKPKFAPMCNDVSTLNIIFIYFMIVGVKKVTHFFTFSF